MEKRFDGELLPEDYQEPRCVICDVTENGNLGGSIPLERIIGKYDEYMGEKDYEGARRHLNYWLEEGQITQDHGFAKVACNAGHATLGRRDIRVNDNCGP